MNEIKMVDLGGQYQKIKEEVDKGIKEVIDTTAFINGKVVKEFQSDLEKYIGEGIHATTCGNGTDALQIALMALGLEPGDEVIVPAFTYVASAEVIALLRLTPVMVDVDENTFNISIDEMKKALSEKTRAIIPVHLFGQSADMEPILKFAKEHNLYVVEDNAQAIGAYYTFSDGRKMKTGTMGTIGCTSFFPSKNLGCFGDGGAIFCRDEKLAERIHMIANHGQKVKYYHTVIGCNSRLDSIQAAVLKVKLKHLDEYCTARYEAAQYYTAGLKGLESIVTPYEAGYSTHVYHQYTLKVNNGRRDELKEYLATKGIPSMIYYPLALQEQEAFKGITKSCGRLETSKECARSVLSIPMHTELTKETMDYIIESIMNWTK